MGYLFDLWFWYQSLGQTPRSRSRLEAIVNRFNEIEREIAAAQSEMLDDIERRNEERRRLVGEIAHLDQANRDDNILLQKSNKVLGSLYGLIENGVA